jgi:hypothetical protein
MFNEYLKGNKRITANQFFILLTLLLIFFIVVMRYLDSFLITEESQNGIVSFELAKETSKSGSIINAWNETARIAAGISLGLDFLFLLVYSLFIAVLIGKLNDSLWKDQSFYIVGKFLIGAIFIAAFFDSIENVALIKIMLGDSREIWPLFAYYFASLKFLIILSCIVYISISSIVLLIKKIKK